MAAGIRQRLCLLQNITGSPGAPGDPAVFLPKNSLSVPYLGMKELRQKYYSWDYSNDGLQ